MYLKIIMLDRNLLNVFNLFGYLNKPSTEKNKEKKIFD